MSQELNNQPEQQVPQLRKFKAIVIDTLNSLQNDKYVQHMKEQGNPNFDAWRDFGVEILDLYTFIKTRKNDIVQVLGREGTGKTVGAYFLDPETTLYLNCDDKPLTFPNGNRSYNAEKKNYQVPINYEQVKYYIDAVSKPERLHPDCKGRLTVFILAHIDEFKAGAADRERMRVLGKMATKLNIEGGVSHTYYTWVDPDINKPEEERYKLLTKNNGANTGRSPMGMFEDSKIPNNFQIILDKIIEAR